MPEAQTFTDVQPVQQSFTNVTPLKQPPTMFDHVKHGAQEFWDQINPVQAVKGMAQLAAHPIDTYAADVESRKPILAKAEDAFKRGDYGQAMAHGLYAFIPFMGPNLERSGEQLNSGDIAGGVGSTLGMGAALAAPELAKGIKLKIPVGEMPERMYQSALKPSTSLPTSQVKDMVRTGLEEKIPVSAEGAKKLDGLISDLGDQVKAELQSKTGATVDPAAIAQRADQLKTKFANQVTPDADLAAIDASKKEFLKNNPTPIPAADAQAIKQGTYAQLKSKAYGELGSATVEAQKALARGIKEELETQFPEIKELNAAQGKLINLDGSLEKAIRRIDNHQLLGIGTPAAAMAGGVATGTPAGALAGGILKVMLDNPEIKSKLAYALAHASKSGMTIDAAMARVAAYSTALGNSQPDEQTSGSQP